MAWGPTTALREPYNYGLRGWISTRSNDLAQGTVAGTFEGVLLKYLRLAVCESGSCGICGHPAAMLWGLIQGSASGMKMSSGQIGRRLLGLAVAGMTLVSGGMALAAQPQPWEMTLQPAASPVMENIISFHNLLLWLITLITLFVLVLLVIVVVKFNAKTNPVPSKTTHNTLIEVAWTLIPVLILVAIAVPSFRLLFQQLDIPKADLTVKVTGKQWYWSYA